MTTYLDGIYLDGKAPDGKPMDYYASEGLSNSRMKLLEQSAAHYKHALENPRGQSVWENVVHTLILEPKRPAWWVAAPEGMKFNTSEGKAWKRDQTKPVITHSEWTRACGCRDAVMGDPNARKCFTGGYAEVAVFHTDAVTGVQLRGKLDYVPPGRCITDIKTCSDARWEEFSLQFRKQRYARQMALYLDMWNGQAERCKYPIKTDFVFVAVEDEPPHGVCLHHFSTLIPGTEMVDPTYALGCMQYKKLASYYADTVAQGRFPGYDTEPVYRGEDLSSWEKRKVGM